MVVSAVRPRSTDDNRGCNLAKVWLSTSERSRLDSLGNERCEPSEYSEQKGTGQQTETPGLGLT